MPSAVSLVGGAVGAGVGASAASGSEAQSQAAYQQALQDYQNAQIPTIAEQQWNLQQEAAAGQLTPDQLSAIGMGPNAMGSINTNPAYTQAQMSALQSLGQLGQGGLTAQERANIISANQQAEGGAQAANAAVVQAMNAKGMGGSGAALAAQLSNNQSAANLASQQGGQINAQAQNQALAALSQQGQMATGMQGQQFGQQAAVAQAQNAINQFNTQNQQQVAGYNTQTANQAQAANLANAQAIANQNTSIANQQQAHNTGLYQQQFQNQMAQAQGEAGAEGNLGGYFGQQAANTVGEWTAIAGGGAQAAGAYAGSKPSSSTPSTEDDDDDDDDDDDAVEGAGSQGGMVPRDLKHYSKGGNVGYSGSRMQANPGGSAASWQPTYANGGEVSTLGMYSAAHGGEVPCYDQGGMMGDIGSVAQIAMFMNKGGDVPCYDYGGTVSQNHAPSTSDDLSSLASIAMFLAKGGKVPSYAGGGGAGGGAGGAGAGAGAGGTGAGNAGGGHGGGGHGGHAVKGGGTPYGDPWKRNYADGGSIAPNPYSPGVSPNINSGMHPATQGGGTTQRDSRDQNSAAYSGGMSSPMSSADRAAIETKLAQMQANGNGAGAVPVGQAPAMSPQASAQSNAILTALLQPNRGYGGPAANPSQMNPLTFQGQAPGQIPAQPQMAPQAPMQAAPPMPPQEAQQPQGMAAGGSAGDSSGSEDSGDDDSFYQAYQAAQQKLTPQAPSTGAAYSGSTPQNLTPQQKSAIMAVLAGPKQQSYMSNGGEAQYDFNTGGNIRAKVSPDELYYSPKQARDVAQQKASPREVGQKIPGKAPVKGDSKKNDIVDAKLQAGGVVVPRTVANSDDDEKILNFVRDTLNKKKK